MGKPGLRVGLGLTNATKTVPQSPKRPQGGKIGVKEPKIRGHPVFGVPRVGGGIPRPCCPLRIQKQSQTDPEEPKTIPRKQSKFLVLFGLPFSLFRSFAPKKAAIKNFKRVKKKKTKPPKKSPLRFPPGSRGLQRGPRGSSAAWREP